MTECKERIEITPQMIEAGLDALRLWLSEAREAASVSEAAFASALQAALQANGQPVSFRERGRTAARLRLLVP